MGYDFLGLFCMKKRGVSAEKWINLSSNGKKYSFLARISEAWHESN
jgi:hypothetical protein